MNNLKIQKYKCLKNIEIDDLKRVNLFTGKNNSGKSTILEAISLYETKGIMSWIEKILEKRGETLNYTNENNNIEPKLNLLSSFFPDRNISFDKKDAIKINSGNDNYSFRIVKYILEEKVEKDEVGNSIRAIKTKYVNPESTGNVSYGLEIIFNSKSLLIYLDKHIFRVNQQFSCCPYNLHFIDSKGDDVLNNSISWDKIALTKKEELVIDALKIIEPNISGLSFIADGNSRTPIIKLQNSTNLYPLSAMGEGINRILSLILALVNSDNGIFLIDEFENGLHYSVQEQFWKIIFEISIKLNIQVFATTHSNDAIISFANVLEQSEKYEGSLFRLDRKSDEIIANLFTKKEITEAAKQKINLR